MKKKRNKKGKRMAVYLVKFVLFVNEDLTIDRHLFICQSQAIFSAYISSLGYHYPQVNWG